jgi:hypothetical protein
VRRRIGERLTGLVERRLLTCHPRRGHGLRVGERLLRAIDRVLLRDRVLREVRLGVVERGLRGVDRGLGLIDRGLVLHEILCGQRVEKALHARLGAREVRLRGLQLVLGRRAVDASEDLPRRDGGASRDIHLGQDRPWKFSVRLGRVAFPVAETVCVTEPVPGCLGLVAAAEPSVPSDVMPKATRPAALTASTEFNIKVLRFTGWSLRSRSPGRRSAGAGRRRRWRP